MSVKRVRMSLLSLKNTTFRSDSMNVSIYKHM